MQQVRAALRAARGHQPPAAHPRSVPHHATRHFPAPVPLVAAKLVQDARNFETRRTCFVGCGRLGLCSSTPPLATCPSSALASPQGAPGGSGQARHYSFFAGPGHPLGLQPFPWEGAQARPLSEFGCIGETVGAGSSEHRPPRLCWPSSARFDSPGDGGVGPNATGGR